MAEALEIEIMMEDFVAGWHSHGAKVKGYANLLFGQFVVIIADEAQTGVSGCSTDSSVRLIKKIEEHFNTSMFDRMNLAFVVKDKVQVLPIAHIAHALANDFINPNTIFFNNIVLNKKELLEKWMIPVKDSWLAERFLKNIKAGT